MVRLPLNKFAGLLLVGAFILGAAVPVLGATNKPSCPERFAHFTLYEAGRRETGHGFRDVPLPETLRDIALPKGYRFNGLSQWKDASRRSNYQLRIGDDLGQDVSFMQFSLEESTGTLMVEVMETVASHQGNGLGRALVAAADRMTEGAARQALFAADHANEKVFEDLLRAGKSIADAASQTPLGKQLTALGFKFDSVELAPSARKLRPNAPGVPLNISHSEFFFRRP